MRYKSFHKDRANDCGGREGAVNVGEHSLPKIRQVHSYGGVLTLTQQREHVGCSDGSDEFSGLRAASVRLT